MDRPAGDAKEADDAFDFEAECIDTYKAAKENGDTDARIKALALIQKVNLPKGPVNQEKPTSDNRALAKAAQNKLRGRKS